MSKFTAHLGGIMLAALVAGPTFLLMTGLAELYSKLPAPIVFQPESVLLLIWLSVPATVVGLLIALPVNALGAAAMLALGKGFSPARTRIGWALAGAVLGGLGVWLIGAPSSPSFALVTTSAVCGWLCSRHYRPEPVA